MRRCDNGIPAFPKGGKKAAEPAGLRVPHRTGPLPHPPRSGVHGGNLLLLPQPGLRRGRESALENAHERPGRRAAGAHRRGVLRRENALEGGKEWLKSMRSSAMERRASAASSRSRKSPSAPRAGSTTCSNPCTTRTRRSSSPWITRPSPGKCTGCSARRRCWSSLTAWPATTACGWRTRRSAGRPTSRSCAAATAWAWRASSARCPCKRPISARSTRSCTPPRRPSSRRRSAS